MNIAGLNLSACHTVYLEPEQYLPYQTVSTDMPWSIGLNILTSFRLSDYVTGKVAQFIEYQDLRGKHRLPIDYTDLDFESAILFSNMVQISIRGSIDEVCLKLVGIPEGVTVETEVVQVQFVESRSFVDSEPMAKATRGSN